MKAVRGFARPAETSTLDQRLDAMRVLLQDRPLVLPPQDADMHSAQSSQQYANFTPASPEVNSACIAGAVSGTDPSERTQISDESAAGPMITCLLPGRWLIVFRASLTQVHFPLDEAVKLVRKTGVHFWRWQSKAVEGEGGRESSVF